MHRVLVVGEGLFADTLSALMQQDRALGLVNRIHSEDIGDLNPNEGKSAVVIFVDGDGTKLTECALLLSKLQLPIIYATPGQTHLRIFLQHKVAAEFSSLVNQISMLVGSADTHNQ